MALSGWDNDKKLTLTIDSSNVDEDLTDFPVLVTLSSGTGQTSFDITRVFDELTTVTGTRKIAVTDSNDNQLYTEIERWDWENEEANLWVKVPAIASGTDTDLSLYYDSTHDDNVHYVGGVGDLSYEMVVDIGEEATYDTVDAKMPSVIKESDTSYKMWYTGNNPTGRILYAVSENGTTWSGHQMVLDYNQIAYDTSHAYTPCVIKESDSSYKMWYSGNSGNVRILYSTSTDGITWATPQLVVDIGNISQDSTHAYTPSVIKESPTSYKMWYSGHDGTNWRGLYATSTNGTTWSNHQLVVDINEEGTYDTNGALGPTVIKESDTSYKMWYGGDDGSNRRMLYATSTNGTTWSNHQLSLNVGAEGTNDTTYAYYQSVIKDGLDYKMWYSGYDGANYRILYSPYWSTNVWDGNFTAVYHMNQDPSGGTDAVKDSTPHVNHGTSAGTMLTEDLVDGKIGKGIDFDGGDDYINYGTGAILDDITNITIESTVKLGGWGEGGFGRIIAKSNTGNAGGWQIFVTTPNGLAFLADYATTDATWYAASTMSLDTWAHVAVQHTRGSGLKTDGKMFVDGDSKTITGGTDGTGAVQSDAAEDLLIGSRKDLNREFDGIIDEVRISNVHRSASWLKATYYSNWNNFITFDEYISVIFTFSNPIPVDLSTVYGLTQQLYLTTTVTGTDPSYVYDATFYDASDSSVINSTVSGVQNGQPAGVIMSTVSGIDYQWYITATSSGVQDTSSTYTFTNRFLCEGQVQVSDAPASGIPVRLYLRDTGEYIGGTTSAGVSGTFEIETTHNDYHYAVALYTSDDTNAIIADWLTPSN